MKIASFLAVLLLPPVCLAQQPQLQLAPVFGDHMVLQRDTRAAIWGQARPDARVLVEGSWPSSEVAEADADRTGQWRLDIATPGAGGPFTLRIRGDDETLEVKDVLVGEVWVCSGQSNMEWEVRSSDNATDEIANATHPRIRLFDVGRSTAMDPKRVCEGSWQTCDPSTIAGFSAVGYFFGRYLQRELDVPIGLIGTNWGGTVAEAWTSEAALRADFPEFGDTLDQIAKARSGAEEDSLATKQADWWKNLEVVDPGVRGRWMNASFDADGWKEVALPGTWATIELGSFDGCLWYRREVEVPDAWRGRDLVLELGPVDDMDLTWFGGELVGETRSAGRHATPRSYRVPAGAHHVGKNVIVVCAVDTGGAGRVGADPAQMRLRPADDDGPGIPLAGTWHYQKGSAIGDLGAFPQTRSFHQNSPTALHNGMIAPLVPFGIRGAIWYQGESNRKRAVQYRRLFPAMIADWRNKWGRDFSFYFVQIAPFAYGGDSDEAALLREAQAMTLAVPGTGMAVTMDIGNPRDIHPRNKQDVGKRLALCALAQTYGRTDVAYRGPTYEGMRVEDKAIRLQFAAAEGLTTGGEAPTYFTIAGADRVFHPATAVIDGETIVVRSPDVPAPVAVRFAWGAADQPNLKNAAGLPASSFRTDDW